MKVDPNLKNPIVKRKIVSSNIQKVVFSISGVCIMQLQRHEKKNHNGIIIMYIVYQYNQGLT